MAQTAGAYLGGLDLILSTHVAAPTVIVCQSADRVDLARSLSAE